VQTDRETQTSKYSNREHAHIRKKKEKIMNYSYFDTGDIAFKK
jgi:hypothetical protein